MDSMIKYMYNQLPETPQFSVVLGSGLSSITDDLTNTKIIPFSSIPDYPKITVSGHKGEFVFGYLEGIPILCARGRFHFYEGLSLSDVTVPIRLFSSLNIPNLIITNSAGCVNLDWNIGDIMLIIGHLDFTFRNGNPKIDYDKKIYKEDILISSLRSLQSRLQKAQLLFLFLHDGGHYFFCKSHHKLLYLHQVLLKQHHNYDPLQPQCNHYLPSPQLVMYWQS